MEKPRNIQFRISPEDTLLVKLQERLGKSANHGFRDRVRLIEKICQLLELQDLDQAEDQLKNLINVKELLYHSTGERDPLSAVTKLIQGQAPAPSQPQNVTTNNQEQQDAPQKNQNRKIPKGFKDKMKNSLKGH